MARQEALPQALEWGRTPEGEFFIKVIIPISIDGRQARVPIRAFILTKEEENMLKASLFGLVPAAEISTPNGHKETPKLRAFKR